MSTAPDARTETPAAIRRRIRAGRLTGPTNGLAPGYVQCNLLILPERFAEAFADFCAANEAACPVLARSRAGDPALPALGADLDLRSDLPSYRVFRDGRAAGDMPDIAALWQDDFVAFAFGCSFSFEEALAAEGVALRYLDRGDREAVYLTDIDAAPAGRFKGKVVASMRPLRPADAIRAITVTAKYPGVHGAPIHIGKPAMIGVDLDKPLDTIGRTRVMDDELPVFWACGLTPQMALADAGLPLCITHTSAHMLITDLRLADLAGS
ncbi:MAG TPA: DUF1445 domain-containing protein [Alphaproteobacteria bacterium]|nr:DUF1445 domain-containing protein [Alphaproteobacteria bacterium]